MNSGMKTRARWRCYAKDADGHQVSPMSPAAVPSPPLVDVPVPRRRRHGLGQLIIRTPGRGMRRVRILELAGITLHVRLPTLRHCARPHLRHHASHWLLHVPPHWESGVHRTRERVRSCLSTLVSRPASIRLIPASGSSIWRIRRDRTALVGSRIGHPCLCTDHLCGPFLRTGHPCEGLCPFADC